MAPGLAAGHPERGVTSLRTKGGSMTAAEIKRKLRNFPEADLRRRIALATGR